mmetsp:Transcript_23503/g.53908  ORF Transcript_23503/g.53908 Transcript_23503/m.53908 type:complete len:257 (-) Transcript_23503:1806-2576(-)
MTTAEWCAARKPISGGWTGTCGSGGRRRKARSSSWSTSQKRPRKRRLRTKTKRPTNPAPCPPSSPTSLHPDPPSRADQSRRCWSSRHLRRGARSRRRRRTRRRVPTCPSGNPRRRRPSSIVSASAAAAPATSAATNPTAPLPRSAPTAGSASASSSTWGATSFSSPAIVPSGSAGSTARSSWRSDTKCPRRRGRPSRSAPRMNICCSSWTATAASPSRRPSSNAPRASRDRSGRRTIPHAPTQAISASRLRDANST